MSEKDLKASDAEPVPPISDGCYEPPTTPIADPVGGSPIIDRPPFDGEDEES